MYVYIHIYICLCVYTPKKDAAKWKSGINMYKHGNHICSILFCQQLKMWPRPGFQV